MDFQSAMETFAEAWVAANTKTDQVQSQALALTHKASPPSRPNSVTSLPRTPPSHLSHPSHQSQQQPQQHHHQQQQQQQQQQQRSTPQPSSIHSSHQPQVPIATTPQAPPFIAHGQHTKREVNSSPKHEGFDLSKSSTVTGKSPVPVHCVVEAIHSIAESRLNLAREKWRSPHVEIDTYVIIPAAVPFQDLVGEALVRLGYPTDLIPSARGSIVIRNWKPLPMEKVADEPLRTVGDILAELTTVATLKIQVYRTRPPPPSPTAEVRDQLLRLLLLHNHAHLVSAGCPLDEMTLSSLCRGGNELSEEARRNFESWLQQQQLGLGMNSMIPTSNHRQTQSPRPDSNGPVGPGGAIGPPHPAMLPYSHKTRMRTSFDPELELPRLQKWFGENQHPSRQQIQHYVSELNSLESRRGRKPLDVNNVVYWFKNARAAQKRAETRGINGYSPPGLSPRGASIVSEDCSDEEDDLRHQSTSPSPRPPSSPPVGPLSLTTRPEDQQPPISAPVVKREETRVSSGSEDDEASPTGSLPPGFSLVPSPMFGHGIMYMSPYLPPRPGCPTSMLDERRKRNRTFIDPVTEVPRLENWFGHNTHPSHALILKYTEELNRMPYRQKFPRLEPKNVQFWFKNRRAKCKRLKMALFDGESPQPHAYHAD